LLRWTHITSYVWNGNAVAFRGLDQAHRDLEMEAVTTPELRSEVRNIVEKRAALDWLGMDRVLGGGTRKQLTARGVGAAAVAYVLVSVAVFGTSAAGSHEYIRGVQLGIGAAILKLVFDACRPTDSGAPLVRLFLKIDWPSMLAAMLIAAGCYYVTRQIVFPSPWIAVPLGMISGLAASVVAGMLYREKVDVCENGVVLVRWPFLPWERLRVLKWEREGRSSLLLRSGWRRIRVRVPIEHRDIVDRVLHTKVGIK
jgi:hypothetical protein